jgi:hypothetical protein
MLVGTFEVAGTGVLDGTTVSLAPDQLTLVQPCGTASGGWVASDTGEASASIDSIEGGCITGGGRDWTKELAGHRMVGPDVALTDQRNEVLVVLKRTGGAPPLGATESTTVPLPAGLRSVADTTGSFARAGDPEGVGVRITPGSVRAVGELAGCRRSLNLVVLHNENGSWATMRAPGTRAVADVCTPTPELVGIDPYDAFERTSVGGIDSVTGELVLIGADGTEIIRLDPRDSGR